MRNLPLRCCLLWLVCYGLRQLAVIAGVQMYLTSPEVAGETFTEKQKRRDISGRLKREAMSLPEWFRLLKYTLLVLAEPAHQAGF